MQPVMDQHGQLPFDIEQNINIREGKDYLQTRSRKQIGTSNKNGSPNREDIETIRRVSATRDVDEVDVDVQTATSQSRGMN